MLVRLVLDPACADARALAAQHDQRARLLAGAVGSRLSDIVAEERVSAFREHQLLCARCLNYATPCASCGRDSAKHSLFCGGRWRSVRRAPSPEPSPQASHPLVTKEPPAKRAQAKRLPRSAFEILGVAPGASLAAVRRAYHERAMQYHPDRTMGLAPELRKLAEERMREINDAYRRVSNGLL